MCTMDYTRAVHAAGGIPVNLTVISDADYAIDVLEKLDGVIMAGGPDISPELYGEKKEDFCGVTVPWLDEFELLLLEHAVDMRIPVLGICRGLQLINVFFGGTLYQDIYTQREDSLKHSGYKKKTDIAHEVTLTSPQLLKIFEKKSLKVNSFHHQAVKTLAPGLTPAAFSPDGYIEAFEKDNITAVQWHPEMMYEVFIEQLKLFRVFHESCLGR